MSGLSMIDSKRGGNFQLVLKRIEYEIKDKKIYIDKATLEKEKDRFPVGD